MVSIGNEWDGLLKDEWEKPYYKRLRGFLKREYRDYAVYPDMNDIFNALKYTSFSDVKAVILGQDPYHEPGQAHGLCFSVKKGVSPPPSLVNIFTELRNDCGVQPPKHGELTDWAKRGVLLLNTTLTVRRGSANSHRGAGWEVLTDRVISLLNEREKPLAFILWGANARAKITLLGNRAHTVLIAAHPSPLSANKGGFFGCGHFSKTNAFLREKGQGEIDWEIED
ncbi:MAG: uracil-DNA glycosylase [Oscillospiraceae bacterium]|jgi:uracil-DNA glycosylase|nr:uracil-DNA glycosylase [Oscillospiraceae bacterium]